MIYISLVVYTSHDQPNLVYYCVSSIGLILLFLILSLITSSFNAEISQAPQQEIKYNSFVLRYCVEWSTESSLRLLTLFTW